MIFQTQKADHLGREALGTGEEMEAGAIVGITKAKMLEGASTCHTLVSISYCTQNGGADGG